MLKRSLIRLFFLLAAVLLFAGPVSAQKADVDSMTNEELLLLLQSVMQKLAQDDAASSESAQTPSAELDPEKLPEIGTFQVYLNKKLVVEGLPSYMFIQPKAEEPEEEPEPEPERKKDDNACPPRSLCREPDIYCTYYITPDGKCVCMCG